MMPPRSIGVRLPYQRFPTEAAPQWLEIDLKKLSQVDRVRVKWWGLGLRQLKRWNMRHH